MLTTANLEVILFSLPIYQMLFFTIQLISFRKTNPARKYLGLLLLAMTLFLLINALFYAGVDQPLTPWLFIIFIPLLLAIAPLFYIYLISLIKEKNLISSFSKFIMFVPPIVLLLINLITFGFSPGAQKLLLISGDHTILNNSPGASGIYMLIFWIGAGFLPLAQVVLASVKTAKLLRREKATTLEQPAYLAYVQFRWIYLISAGMIIFIVAAVLQLMVVSHHTLASAVVFNLLFLFSSGMAGYFAMKQDELFTNVSRVGVIKPSVGSSAGGQMVLIHAEIKKVVPDEGAGEIIRKIDKHLSQDKPYLDKRFTISDLSRQTGVSRNKLTFVINEVMEKNFYSLVNDYRVREAMDLMRANGKNYTIDAVAEMSGFQSRSSFYACFKKYTGQTPREFMVNQPIAV